MTNQTIKNSEGIVLCISGPSGVGKGTVIEALLKKFPEFNLSISLTTRKPRGEEKDGVEYYFCDKPRFEQLIKEKEILEFDIYSDEYYGTPLAPIRYYLKEQQDVVLDITLTGALQVKKLLPHAVMVFLLPPDAEELERRLTKRQTESEEKIKARLKQARFEINQAGKFEYVLINEKIADTVELLEAIVLAEKSKYHRQEENIKNIVADFKK